jgi:hypothetical protein
MQSFCPFVQGTLNTINDDKVGDAHAVPVFEELHEWPNTNCETVEINMPDVDTTIVSDGQKQSVSRANQSQISHSNHKTLTELIPKCAANRVKLTNVTLRSLLAQASKTPGILDF